MEFQSKRYVKALMRMADIKEKTPSSDNKNCVRASRGGLLTERYRHNIQMSDYKQGEESYKKEKDLLHKGLLTRFFYC